MLRFLDFLKPARMVVAAYGAEAVEALFSRQLHQKNLPLGGRRISNAAARSSAWFTPPPDERIWRASNTKDRARVRSMTPEGLARAVCLANSGDQALIPTWCSEQLGLEI